MLSITDAMFFELRSFSMCDLTYGRIYLLTINSNLRNPNTVGMRRVRASAAARSNRMQPQTTTIEFLKPRRCYHEQRQEPYMFFLRAITTCNGYIADETWLLRTACGSSDQRWARNTDVPWTSADMNLAIPRQAYTIRPISGENWRAS